MLSKLKARILGQELGPKRAFREVFSREGKMDTGFKWGETLTTTDFEFAQRRDCISYALTARIALTLCRNGFVVEKLKRRRDLPGDIDDTRTDEVNDLAEEYQLPLRLPEGIHYERTYGHAVLCIFREGQAAWLEPKSERMINQATHAPQGAYDQIEVKRLHGTNWTHIWVEPQNFVHLRTRPREDLPFHEGVSILETIWDPAETLRKVVWGAGQRFYRGAFMHAQIAGSTPEQHDAIEAKFGNLSPRTQIFTNEHVKIDFPAIGGAVLDPLAYLDMMLYMITITTGIPIDILRGDAEATVAGGAISNAAYFEYLLMQQKPLLPFIHELFTKIGYSLPDDRQIRFDLQYEMDPKDASLVRLNEVEQIARSVWLTMNEQRQIDPRGFSTLPGDKGDEIPALLQLMARPMNGNGAPPASQPTTASNPGRQAPRSPAQDTALVLGALAPAQKHQLLQVIDSYRAQEMSLPKSLERLKETHNISVSEPTYYRWKAKHD